MHTPKDWMTNWNSGVNINSGKCEIRAEPLQKKIHTEINKQK